MRKFFIFLTVLIPLCSIVSSCEKIDPSDPANTPATTAGATGQTTDLEYWQNYLEPKDYNEYVFRILTRDGADHMAEIYAESEKSEPINDAVFKRNRSIEEKFNITIKPVPANEVPESYLTGLVHKSVMASSDDYDFVVHHMVDAGRGAAAGDYYNWANVPHVQMDKPWWSKSAYEGLSVGGKSYLAAGDISYAEAGFSMILVFNKALLSEYGLPDPYALVKSGEWTKDKFAEMVRACSKDNGDGVFDENDTYGLLMAGGGSKVALHLAGGQFMTRRTEDGKILPDLGSNKSVELFDFYLDLYHNGNQTYYMKDNDPKERTAFTAFTDGHALFYLSQMNTMIELRNMPGDFGVLPLPKYDAAQEKYYSYVNGHGPVMFIPKTAPDIERTGRILEALACESAYTVTPAYIDVTMKTKHARDTESAAMIDYVLDGIIYDFGLVYDYSMPLLIINLMDGNKGNLISEFAKFEVSTTAIYQQIVDQYNKIEE